MMKLFVIIVIALTVLAAQIDTSSAPSGVTGHPASQAQLDALDR